MSSLPSISHRLFVAAVGHEAPERLRKSRDQTESQPEASGVRQAAGAVIRAAESALRPGGGEITVSALMSES